ncbi:MAG: DUF262 domain-containing protein [Bryobacteraceae bacterium]
MDIQPKYLTFAELVSKRLFRIPEYQRAYSWKSKHREDLFDDISKLKSKPAGSTHFMATVVGLQRERETIHTDEYTRLDIVDGQQRLTTLILLCKAIEKSLGETDKTEVILRKEIASLLVKNDAGTLLLLQTNHDKSTYFANYLRNGDVPDPGGAKFLADRDLANAIAECERFVSSWKASLLDLAMMLKNRLTFIFHEINDESAVYTVFEVLNSRGLEVAWLDRAKSTLMAIAFEYAPNAKTKGEVIHELHRLWGDIYSIIGLRQGLGSETLRFAATLTNPEITSKVLGDEQALEVISKRCGGKVRKTIELTNWLLDVAKAVDRLEADGRRAAVTKIAHARLLAVSIELTPFNSKEKERLSDAWERVTFRIFGIARRDARTRVGEYVRLSQEIHGMAGTSADYKHVMKELRSLGAGEYAIEEAVKNLQKTDCYTGWEEELRYFMLRYEEHLAKLANQAFENEQWARIWEASPAQSIEHVHPQNPTPGGAWQGALGRGRGQREAHVNRLGNLVLLPPGMNSKVGNREFPFKRKQYRETGLLLLGDVCRKNKWNKQAIEERERSLLSFATDAWADL